MPKFELNTMSEKSKTSRITIIITKFNNKMNVYSVKDNNLVSSTQMIPFITFYHTKKYVSSSKYT